MVFEAFSTNRRPKTSEIAVNGNEKMNATNRGHWRQPRRPGVGIARTLLFNGARRLINERQKVEKEYRNANPDDRMHNVK
jgi:hypothetical protein